MGWGIEWRGRKGMPRIGFLFLPRRGNPIFLFFGNRTQRGKRKEEGAADGENYIGDKNAPGVRSFSADNSTINRWALMRVK